MRDSLNAELGVIAEMKPSSGGVFEVEVNGSLIFSKKHLQAKDPVSQKIYN